MAATFEERSSLRQLIFAIDSLAYGKYTLCMSQLLLDIDEALKAELEKKARARGISVANMVAELVSKDLHPTARPQRSLDVLGTAALPERIDALAPQGRDDL